LRPQEIKPLMMLLGLRPVVPHLTTKLRWQLKLNQYSKKKRVPNTLSHLHVSTLMMNSQLSLKRKTVLREDQTTITTIPLMIWLSRKLRKCGINTRTSSLLIRDETRNSRWLWKNGVRPRLGWARK
jgi:hypothetical protein